MMEGFNKKVYDIVRQIPQGKVMSYGQIALFAGFPRNARAVGYAMHNCPTGVPAHRVVFKDGSLCPSFSDQYRLLKVEKIAFTRNKRVKMEKHPWDGRTLRGEFF